MPPRKKPTEYGGVTKEQLTNHYIDQLGKLAHFAGAPSASARGDLLSPGERCFMVDVRYQPDMFSRENQLIRYYCHCPTPDDALTKLIIPAFAKWQHGRDPNGFPKLVTNRSLKCVTLGLPRYMEIFKTAVKFGALFDGNPMCPAVFILAKHDDKGGLILLSQEGTDDIKSFH